MRTNTVVDKIEWYQGEDLMKPMTFQPEAAVLEEIRKSLEAAPKPGENGAKQKDASVKIN